MPAKPQVVAAHFAERALGNVQAHLVSHRAITISKDFANYEHP